MHALNTHTRQGNCCEDEKKLCVHTNTYRKENGRRKENLCVTRR